MSVHVGRESEGLFYLLVGGPVALFWGLRKLREKRLIENIATSKVRSAAMGLVELAGLAKPRKLLKAPISSRDCCWWNCQVQELRSNGKNSNWVTIKEIPCNELFYLDDKTGQVLINPFGAELRVLTTTSDLNSGTRIQMSPVLNAWGLDDMNWFGGAQRLRVIEQVIPDGAPVYVMGQLFTFGNEPLDKRARLLARLRAVKSDPQQMAAADVNHDGQVDADEWDALRAKKEEEFYQEELLRHANMPNEEHLMVRNPGDSPFIIATGTEQNLVGALFWMAPLGIFGGLCLSGAGVALAIADGWSPLIIVGLLTAGVLVGGFVRQLKINIWGR